MTRLLVAAALLVGSGVGAAAQTPIARSADYLFITNAAGVRGLWVNPAGMALIPEASVMAEVSTERVTGDLWVDQWSVALQSRGLAVGYQRNRTRGGASVAILRAGMAVPFTRGALGLAASRFSQDSVSARSLDVGGVWFASPAFQLGGALRNVGRPVLLDGAALRLTGLAGVQWSYQRFQVLWESAAVEERLTGDSEWNGRHRGGLRFAAPTRIPALIFAAADFGSRFSLDRFTLGVTIGGDRKVAATTSALTDGDRPVFHRFSTAFIATNPVR